MTDLYPGTCKAQVWRRDCLRRTGRGPTGFSMHYNEARCGRKVKQGVELCWQHQREKDRGLNVRLARW